jgi:hypothetical protein
MIPGDETITLSTGKGIILNCSVSNSSYPPAESVDWMHNNTYVRSGSILELPGVSQSEAGVYQCSAYNGYGLPASKKFYVSSVVKDTSTSPTTTVPISATDSVIRTQVTDGVLVEGANTTASDSVPTVFHPFCLLYVVLCLITWYTSVTIF